MATLKQLLDALHESTETSTAEELDAAIDAAMQEDTP